MTFDSRTFRNALGCLPTGVTVIATLTGDGRPVGVTIGSFTSLSLDPPMVLFCLGRTSTVLKDLEASGRFTVSVLAAGQEELSQHFAGSSAASWDGIASDADDKGLPLLLGRSAGFSCRLERLEDGGDHLIVTGSVLSLDYDPQRAPLLFWQGGYESLRR